MYKRVLSILLATVLAFTPVMQVKATESIPGDLPARTEEQIPEEDELVIEGENLKIEGFSKENGTVRITGMVQGIYYGDETRSKKKLFGRLFQ